MPLRWRSNRPKPACRAHSVGRAWVEKAFHSDRCGLRELLEKGLPRCGDTGKPDGFWFERSHFHACFYVTTPMITLVRAGRAAGVMDDDLQAQLPQPAGLSARSAEPRSSAPSR